MPQQLSGLTKVALGLFYVAYLIASVVLVQWLISTGNIYYVSLVGLGAVVVWLVIKGWLGREYLAYLAGAYAVIAVLIATNTLQYGVAAAVIALLIYGGVQEVRKRSGVIVQRAREAVAILTDRPVPDSVSVVDEPLAPGAKGSTNMPTNPPT